MIRELIKIANKLDAKGYYDLASEVDAICREAVGVDKIRELFEELNSRKPDSDHEDLPDTEDLVVPDERMGPLLPGKKDERNPDELSEEDLSDEYLETIVEDIEDYRDPERDPLVEVMEDESTQHDWSKAKWS